MATASPAQQALGAVADALKKETRTIITSHVKPDGDALGCLIAMQRALTQLGSDSIMYISGTGPMAPEWQFLGALGEAVRGEAPADHASRTLICVDCGSAERTGNEDLVKAAPRIINIDHHGDNTRFGEINLVVPGASSTAEILFFIFKMMEVEITAEMAEALYTGILVDSGRFQYTAATPATFRVAADLIALGVDHTAVFRNVYERVPLAKTKLHCRMFDNLTLACGGRLAVAVLSREDFQETGAGGEFTEGLVDSLRAIDGVVVAALVYARLDDGRPEKPYFRVSLRSSSEKVNVQRSRGIDRIERQFPLGSTRTSIMVSERCELPSGSWSVPMTRTFSGWSGGRMSSCCWASTITWELSPIFPSVW